MDILVFLWVCQKYSKSKHAVLAAMLLVLAGIGGCATFEGLREPEIVTYEAHGVSNGLVGVNLAGAEFNASKARARVNFDYVYPTEQDMAYFAQKKFALIRLPFSWERIQPELGKPLNSAEVMRIRDVLNMAQEYGLKVVLDVHNYGTYNKTKLGSSELPLENMADVWGRLAKEFNGHPALWAYGLMNEPQGLVKGVWPKAAQGAIYAIRKQDRMTEILVPGEAWSSAEKWAKVNPEFPLKDPQNKLRYEAHVYFDRDTSGTYKQPFGMDGAGVERVDARLMPFVNWLKMHDAKGFIGEYGVPTGAEWQPVLARALALMHEHRIPSAYWAAGAWWGNYPLSVQPSKGGGDKPQMKLLVDYAVKPLL